MSAVQQPGCSGDNLFTPLDAVQFLTKWWAGSLAGTQTATVKGWAAMTGRHSPGLDNWLVTPLPATATVYHKAGWIPGSGYNDSHEIGVVHAPTGKTYAVAILMDGNPTNYYGKQLGFGKYASCVIYQRFALPAPDPFASCTPP